MIEEFLALTIILTNTLSSNGILLEDLVFADGIIYSMVSILDLQVKMA